VDWIVNREPFAADLETLRLPPRAGDKSETSQHRAEHTKWTTPETAPGSEPLPSQPAVGLDPYSSSQHELQLRRFHLGDAETSDPLRTVNDGDLPALIWAHRDDAQLHLSYPLLLSPPGAHGEDQPIALQAARPLAVFLREAVDASAPHREGSQILKQNLARLECAVRDVLQCTGSPMSAIAVLQAAGQRVQDELSLDKHNCARTQEALIRLIKRIPESTTILPYSRHAAIHLLLHMVRWRRIAHHERTMADAGTLIQRAQSLLQIECATSGGAREPEYLEQAMDLTTPRCFDAAPRGHHSRPGRGMEQMPFERRQRIKAALQVLVQYQNQRDIPLVTVVHSGLLAYDIENGGLPKEIQRVGGRRYLCTVHAGPAPCIEGAAMFDEAVQGLREFLSAMRLIRLELDGPYDAEGPGPRLTPFRCEHLSEEGSLLAPVIVILTSADAVAGDGMRAFSRLLRSGRPVQMVVEVDPGANHGILPEEEPLVQSRLELAYLGLCHRQAYVAQSTAARPAHLLRGYDAALSAPHMGLHVISSGWSVESEPPAVHPWLFCGAAIEGRAHPLFQFEPQSTPPSGLEISQTGMGQISLASNPTAGDNWPSYPFAYRVRDGGAETTIELGFTFADFALLAPTLRHHFRLVPEELESQALVSVPHYLNLPSKQAQLHLPFVWVVDSNSVLRRAVLSRALVMACRDRQNYWQTLQQLAGIRDAYVAQAVSKASSDALRSTSRRRPSGTDG
jgi:hypothetical protein